MKQKRYDLATLSHKGEIAIRPSTRRRCLIWASGAPPRAGRWLFVQNAIPALFFTVVVWGAQLLVAEVPTPRLLDHPAFEIRLVPLLDAVRRRDAGYRNARRRG